MAEDHTPPALELTNLFLSYPGLAPECPSSWFVWSDNSGIPPKAKIATICHADMRFHGEGFDHLVTACPKADPLSIRYIRMLIHGPFKAFSDTISLRTHKGLYYIQVDHLEKWPANVLFNFCIATRVPIEFPQLFELWNELTKSGYPELFAFLLSYTTDGVPFKRERSFPSRNHLWFDPAADWTKILAGHPDLTCKDFKGYPSHILPTNQIWGKSDAHYKLSNMTDDKVAEFFGVKRHEKPAPKARSKSPAEFQKVYWNAEAPAIQPQPAGGQLAAHWAQIIAQQDQAVQGQFVPNMINAPQPPQPPPLVDWDIDEDDNHNYPHFDEEFNPDD